MFSGYNDENLLQEQPSTTQKIDTFIGILKDPKVLLVTGAVWASTSAMALLEPCLPIWLMDTIHPEVRLVLIFSAKSISVE